MRTLAFNKVVAALTVFIGYAAWYSKHITVIIVGNISRNERSPFIGAFYNNGSFGKAGYYAVSLYKIFLIRIGGAPKLSKEATVLFHFGNILFMHFRIHLVKSMGNYTYGLQVLLHSYSMGMYIHPISKTANDNRVKRSKVFNKLTAKIRTIRGHLARTHYANRFPVL